MNMEFVHSGFILDMACGIIPLLDFPWPSQLNDITRTCPYNIQRFFSTVKI